MSSEPEVRKVEDLPQEASELTPKQAEETGGGCATGQIQVVMGDGSVRFVSAGVSSAGDLPTESLSMILTR